MKKYFIKMLNINGIILDKKQLLKFENYYKYLIYYNSKFNLTNILSEDDVYLKHFLDSAYIAFYLDIDKYEKIIDIGSGAGLPGIVLSIIFPKLDITLVESNKKKISFLMKMKNKLNLNINCIHERAEKLINFREQYDICVSRAVSSMNIISELCLPLVKKNGFFIAYKSKLGKKEYKFSEKKIFRLGGKLKLYKNYYLNNNQNYRELFYIYKMKETPKKYPRDYSLIKLEENI